MRFGIKQKILIVFIAALVFTTGLTALLAVYFTHRGMVAAILGVASVGLLLGIGFGTFWIGRIIDPIASPDEVGTAHDAETLRTEQLKTVEQPLAHSKGATWTETQAAREAALPEAERLAISRGEFLAQMSHELRTPLNAILGYAQILRQDPHLTERHARGLAMIEDSGHRLLTLINDILDISRIGASKLELHPINTHLAAFLRTVCDIVRVKAEEKCLDFTCQAGPDLPIAVRIDDKRLQQVLLNLLGHAVKFTNSGHIQLRVAKLTEPREQKGVPTARLIFEIQASGMGMTGEQLETMLLPFEQAVDAQRRQGGVGLDLAISRQLVRLMGGDIQVRSELDRCSIIRFELSVPIAASEVDTVPTPQIATENDRTPESTTIEKEEMVIPPLAEMETLYELALAGSMRDIRDRAKHLEDTDPRYSPFVKRLQGLAQSYQSQAILALVGRYRAQAALLEGSADLSTGVQRSSGQ